MLCGKLLQAVNFPAQNQGSSTSFQYRRRGGARGERVTWHDCFFQGCGYPPKWLQEQTLSAAQGASTPLPVLVGLGYQEVHLQD